MTGPIPSRADENNAISTANFKCVVANLKWPSEGLLGTDIGEIVLSIIEFS